MKAPMRISPSQVIRADKSLRTELTFKDERIPKDIQAKKANPIKRAHSTLEEPPRYNRKQHFITKYHDGKGVPGLADASVLLSEIRLMTGEKLAGVLSDYCNMPGITTSWR
jgi:hypothetical protein